MSKQIYPANTQILWSLMTLTFLGLAFLLSSCGQIVDPNLLEKGRRLEDSAYPTIANYSNWKGIWKKGSWIVSLEDAQWRKGKNERLAYFKEAVAQSFVGNTISPALGIFGASPSQEQRKRAATAFTSGDNLSFELIAQSPGVPIAPAFSEGDTPWSFLYIEVKDAQLLARTVTDALSLPFEILARAIGGKSLDSERGLVAWQMKSLEGIPEAKFVEPNLYSVFNAEPDPAPTKAAKPYVPAEFEFRSRMVENLRLIKADLAYSFTGQGEENRRPINVAILDTGVDSKHPDLEGQMWVNEREVPQNNQDDDGNGAKDDINGFDATFPGGEDFGISPKPGSADLGGPGNACPTPAKPLKGDELLANCGHGTHVAGIVAAKHGGDPQTLGVCPNCKIMSIRVAERCLQPNTSQNKNECVIPKAPLTENQYEVDGNIADIAQVRALQYLFDTRSASNSGALAVNIVNMSLGKYFRSRSMAYLIQNLQKSNVVVVAAAGNDDTDTPSYPAAYESVVAVCATSAQGFRGTYGKAIFSNFGEWVDICAPGTNILSTVPGKSADGSGRTDSKPGTSQATPFVSGAIGFLMSISPNQKDAKQFINIIKKAASYNILYFADANLVPGSKNDSAYLACYEDRTSCDYLLGTGFLNLYKAVNPNADDAFSEVDFTKPSPVSGGCVVSSIGASSLRGSLLSVRFFTGVPFVLLTFLTILFVRRKSLL